MQESHDATVTSIRVNRTEANHITVEEFIEDYPGGLENGDGHYAVIREGDIPNPDWNDFLNALSELAPVKE